MLQATQLGSSGASVPPTSSAWLQEAPSPLDRDASGRHDATEEWKLQLLRQMERMIHFLNSRNYSKAGSRRSIKRLRSKPNPWTKRLGEDFAAPLHPVSLSVALCLFHHRFSPLPFNVILCG